MSEPQMREITIGPYVIRASGSTDKVEWSVYWKTNDGRCVLVHRAKGDASSDEWLVSLSRAWIQEDPSKSGLLIRQRAEEDQEEKEKLQTLLGE